MKPHASYFTVQCSPHFIMIYSVRVAKKKKRKNGGKNGGIFLNTFHSFIHFNCETVCQNKNVATCIYVKEGQVPSYMYMAAIIGL